MRWDRPHPMARREDGGRGKMRKKKKIPKTGIIGITGRLKLFVFDPCQSTFPY